MYEYYDGIYHNNKKSATNVNCFVLYFVHCIVVFIVTFSMWQRGEKRLAEIRSTIIYHEKQFFSFVVLLYFRLVHCFFIQCICCVPIRNMNSIRNDNRLFLRSTQNIFSIYLPVGCLPEVWRTHKTKRNCE